MRIETVGTSIKLVEKLDDGEWAVRWDFTLKPNTSGVYWHEEERFNFIPTIEDIQQIIIEWFNKQTDSVIKHGFCWNKIQVLLNDENKFNYKTITDEAARRETAIAIWDKENPDIAGKDFVYKPVEDEDVNNIPLLVSTGRPKSLLPVTLKLGETNLPENFYTFQTLTELQEFFSSGVDYLLEAYSAGWTKIATFDWAPYIKALEEL